MVVYLQGRLEESPDTELGQSYVPGRARFRGDSGGVWKGWLSQLSASLGQEKWLAWLQGICRGWTCWLRVSRRTQGEGRRVWELSRLLEDDEPKLREEKEKKLFENRWYDCQDGGTSKWKVERGEEQSVSKRRMMGEWVLMFLDNVC